MASALAFGLTACATVKPWEREQLGSRAMAGPYGRDGTTAEHRDKVVPHQDDERLARSCARQWLRLHAMNFEALCERTTEQVRWRRRRFEAG